jgi:hypothetical protein
MNKSKQESQKLNNDIVKLMYLKGEEAIHPHINIPFKKNQGYYGKYKNIHKMLSPKTTTNKKKTNTHISATIIAVQNIRNVYGMPEIFPKFFIPKKNK